MLAAILLQLVWPGRLSKLFLRIHSAEVEALISNRAKFVEDVKQAIEAAFIARGHYIGNKLTELTCGPHWLSSVVLIGGATDI